MFQVCVLDDTGTYSVEITEFVKNGERDQTDCWLEVSGKLTPKVFLICKFKSLKVINQVHLLL